MSSNSACSEGRGTAPDSTGRPVGGTEYSWCKAVTTGTGITVVSFLLSKVLDKESLESAIRSLQRIHPVLGARLRFDPSRSTFILIPSSPYVCLQCFDISATEEIIHSTGEVVASVGERFHLLVEHELNRNEWPSGTSNDTCDLMFASVYAIDEGHIAVLVRAHTVICDRSSAVTILRELVQLIGGDAKVDEIAGETKINLGIEELIPPAKAKKPFWARGLDVLGYSLNSFRLANLNFLDKNSCRRSRLVRLQLRRDETQRLLAACAARGIKLCAAMTAAGFIAARSTKELGKEQQEKYGVVTLVDSRSLLEPALRCNHMGFYHAAIMISHDVSGNDGLWELAHRCYSSFSNAKKNNKQFTDIGDLNFLMNSAIDKPTLTPNGSMRTSFITVFEETVVEDSGVLEEALGVEDYVGCSSVHGIGPSIAVFDVLRNGELDCACVYPSPLHSRAQMEKTVEDMKKILLRGC